MRPLPTPPSPGKPVSATLIRQLIDAIRERTILPGANMSVSRGPYGTTLNQASASANRKNEFQPFDVRYVKADPKKGISKSGFQIYIPQGCVSCGSTCEALNCLAFKEGVNYYESIPDWYLIKVTESLDNPHEGFVDLHIKGPSGIEGIDPLKELPKRYFYVEGDAGEENRESKYGQGDELVIRLGHFSTLETSYLGDVYKWSYEKSFSTPVIVNSNSASLQFALCHMFNNDRNGVFSYKHVSTYVLNNCYSTGGVPYNIDKMIEIPTDAKGVYLKIDCSVSPFVGNVVTYEDDEAAASEKGPFDIMIPLYTLEDGRVKIDRRQSLSQILTYQ